MGFGYSPFEADHPELPSEGHAFVPGPHFEDQGEDDWFACARCGDDPGGHAHMSKSIRLWFVGEDAGLAHSGPTYKDFADAKRLADMHPSVTEGLIPAEELIYYTDVTVWAVDLMPYEALHSSE